MQTPEVGTRYKGVVRSVRDFGAFIEILPGVEALCHISELGEGFIDQVSDVVNVGDELEVEIINVDDRGKIKVSRKVVLNPEGRKEGGDDEGRPRRPRRDDDRPRGRGGRDDDGRPRRPRDDEERPRREAGAEERPPRTRDDERPRRSPEATEERPRFRREEPEAPAPRGRAPEPVVDEDDAEADVDVDVDAETDGDEAPRGGDSERPRRRRRRRAGTRRD
jgi:predicted RNA-binding protein with RPS1 domain